MREWIRDRSLGILIVSIVLVTWLGLLVVQWINFVDEQQDGQQAEFWSRGFMADFRQSTLENWQSEFLQLSAFTIACAYLVYKGSSESADSGERIEAKLDALLEKEGLKPREIERKLPKKFQRMG